MHSPGICAHLLVMLWQVEYAERGSVCVSLQDAFVHNAALKSVLIFLIRFGNTLHVTEPDGKACSVFICLRLGIQCERPTSSNTQGQI